MTLTIEQLHKRLTTQFSDVEQVGSSIMRFTRKAGDCPFAVYYIDLVQELPKTRELLTQYQDRIIGEHYFEGRKSLQWSNYLLFITTKDQLASRETYQTKRMIEDDRNYARKFVVSEDEIDSILTPPQVGPAGATSPANILFVWTDHLTKAGLDKVIFSDDNLPTRLRSIEALSNEDITIPKTRRRKVRVKSPPFIRSLQLKKYREFPLQREFDFGKVNLILGPNASGKTSLLEAIELFYCGRNKRNPEPPLSYELVVAFTDNSTDTAASWRELQTFRDRNLSWYGQSEIKTNNLYQSFARFNFLNTDAAVSLSTDKDSGQRLEEDLSKLLVGPDASKTWHDIERVNEGVENRLQELHQLESQTKEELTAIEDQMKKTGEVKQESDLIRIHLEEMLNRFGWVIPQGDKEAFADSLIGALSELISIVQQATKLDLGNLPLSSNGLGKYYSEFKLVVEKAEPDITLLELQEKKQKHLADAIERDREALDLANQAKRLVNANLSARVEARSELENTVATYSSWLAGLDDDALSVLSTANKASNVKEYHLATISKLSEVQARLANAKSEYANFSKLQEESVNLAQELRQIANRIIQSSSNPDECPLCHTRFEPGNLARHIQMEVNQQLEAVGQRLLNQVQELEKEVRDVTVTTVASAWLAEFCEMANLPPNLPVYLALAEVEKAKKCSQTRVNDSRY